MPGTYSKCLPKGIRALRLKKRFKPKCFILFWVQQGRGRVSVVFLFSFFAICVPSLAISFQESTLWKTFQWGQKQKQ